jgi:hypothetical protein
MKTAHYGTDYMTQ